MLTAEHCAAIRAAIPPHVKVPQEFWSALDLVVTSFHTSETSRKRKPPRRELERWRRIEKNTEALARDLRAIRLEIAAEGFDPFWPNRALRALWPIMHRAESALIGYGILGAGYGGRRQPHRELFYRGILDLWQIHLGQELTYSRSPEDHKPSGSLIQFFQACIAPVLGQAPPLETIVTIIKREKKRRRRFALYAALRKALQGAPRVEIKPAPKRR
jgi:hypothetical protein